MMLLTFSSKCFHILQTNNTVGLSSVSVKKGKGVTLPQKLNVRQMSIWFISEGFGLKYFKSTARILCLNVVNENILFTKIE